VRPDFTCLVIDRGAPYEKAVRRLVEHGHRRIGFYTNSLAGNRMKYQGYQRAMESRGIFDRALVTEGSVTPGATRAFVTAHEAHFREMTAVFASNDRLAAEIVIGLARLGIRVPQDCSVIGYHDSEIAMAIEPTLTTFRQPRHEDSEHATNMVMKLLGGLKVGNVFLVPEWVERESTGPCRRS
jgi:LacI family transcriptional regulator